MTFRTVRPALYSVVFLLIAVNVLLGLSRGIDLVQTQVLANNLIPQERAQPQVAGVKKVPLPHSKKLPDPKLSAASAVILDLDSKAVLFTKDQNKKLPIASTTKIMTALVGVETYQSDQILTVSDLSLVSGSTMGLKVGEQISFRSLLYGMLLNSGNDAAYTIAANYPGGVLAFVAAMNQKVKDLGLTNTHFTNPAGFDDPNHFSSAADLSVIAQAASKHPQIAQVVATKTSVVASEDKAVIHSLHNLNKLLDLPGVIGFKTGYTSLAKENLVTLVERDEHKILIVVLGSDDRFGETKNLIDWVFSNYEWK